MQSSLGRFQNWCGRPSLGAGPKSPLLFGLQHGPFAPPRASSKVQYGSVKVARNLLDKQIAQIRDAKKLVSPLKGLAIFLRFTQHLRGSVCAKPAPPQARRAGLFSSTPAGLSYVNTNFASDFHQGTIA